MLQSACADAGMPAASLWAAVPHYVAVAPNPKGALAILRRLESLVGVTVDASDLETAAVDYERQVTRAVELDPEVQAFVERLERAADAEEGPTDLSQLPSGDVLAREFQRFLRQRGGGQPAARRNTAAARASASRERPLRHHPRRRSLRPARPVRSSLRARRSRRADRRPGSAAALAARARLRLSGRSAEVAGGASSTPAFAPSAAVRETSVEHVVRDLFAGLHARTAHGRRCSRRRRVAAGPDRARDDGVRRGSRRGRPACRRRAVGIHLDVGDRRRGGFEQTLAARRARLGRTCCARDRCSIALAGRRRAGVHRLPHRRAQRPAARARLRHASAPRPPDVAALPGRMPRAV